MGLIKAFFSAIAAVFGLAKQRDAEENSPAMQANAGAKVVQEIQDQAVHDVTTGDLEHIREDAS